jgi:hypothetical protein
MIPEDLRRRPGEKDEEYFQRLRDKLGKPLPNSKGITIERIHEALRKVDLDKPKIANVILALLDDRLPNPYPTAMRTRTFSDGASISDIFCHVGILQLGEKKIDREQRDYLIKPLVDLGIVEPIYLKPETDQFVAGHPVAKSGNNCYRLNPNFVQLLQLSPEEFEEALERWISEDEVRRRMAFQAEAQERFAQEIANPHALLIQDAITIYAKNFLPGFELVYDDYTDGERITEEHQRALSRCGLAITLQDVYPDVILWNLEKDQFWFIEAVISDGEVDDHKVRGVYEMLERSGKSRESAAGFTTAYPDWKTAARRQAKHKNIAPGTYIWIREDPARHYLVESFYAQLESPKERS